MLRANSPMYFVENMEAPLFLYFSHRDDRIDFEQGKEFVRRLRHYKKDYEHYTYRYASHDYGQEEDRIELFQKLEEWLKRKFPPKE